MRLSTHLELMSWILEVDIAFNRPVIELIFSPNKRTWSDYSDACNINECTPRWDGLLE
jgi:hypothetical protein